MGCEKPPREEAGQQTQEREIEGRTETKDNRCAEDNGRDTMSRTGPPQREFSKGQWFTHPRGEHLKHTGAHVQREVLWNRMGLDSKGAPLGDEGL